MTIFTKHDIMQTVMTKGIIESYSDEPRRERVGIYSHFMGAGALAASLCNDKNPALDRSQRDFIMIEPSESSALLQNKETHNIPSFYEIEKSAGTELVGMNEHKIITAASGENKKIATYGLEGCTAVAVVSEFADGTKRGYIQHYPPLGEQLSGLVLRREMGGVERLSPVRCKMVIMTPGEYCKDPDGKWIMMPMSQEHVDSLIIESGMKNRDRDVRVYSYNICHSYQNRHSQGSLMIEFSSDDETTIYTEMLPVKFDEES